MAEGSPKPQSPDKSGSTVFPSRVKAASSILMSLSSLAPGKTPSTLRTSRSGSSQKSVSVVTGHKSGASLTGDNLQPKSSSKLTLREQGNGSGPSMQDLDAQNPAENPSELKMREKTDFETGKSVLGRNRKTRFMRKYPELFRDDVSINPSYTGLGNFPYNVVCRQRFHKNKSRINRRLNKEIQEITMTQTFALDGVRVGRIFTVGFHPSATIVKDFATPCERLRLNRMLCER